MTDTYELSPIGHVVADETGFSLRIAEPYRPGLSGLEGFGYLNVLFWCHLLDDPQSRRIVTAGKPYTQGPDNLGVFATRSPARPNPIALTPVPVLNIDEAAGMISIAYIDAEDGSPILDLKPYTPAVDRIRDVALPEWCATWPQWYEDSATFDWGAVFAFA